MKVVGTGERRYGRRQRGRDGVGGDRSRGGGWVRQKQGGAIGMTGEEGVVPREGLVGAAEEVRK